jgi:hypothetical protein
MLELIALSAVGWSFFESTKNAIKQELLLSNHRARDFTLAIAKASELRLNPNGYPELNKAYFRYVEETAKDPEKFNLKAIRLYNTEGLLLASSVEKEVAEAVDKRTADIALSKETHFRKAIRMKKWEWPEEDKEVISKSKTNLPELPKYAQFVIRFFPHVSVQESTIYAPVYHETKLDVLGAVFVVYEPGNLVLLFENQFSLLQWMTVNYSLIALVLAIVLWGFYFLFQYFTKREGKSSNVQEHNVVSANSNLPLIEKKTVSGAEQEVSELKQIETVVTEELPRAQQVAPVSQEVMDAIYLGSEK